MGAVSELALRPGLDTTRYSKHLKRVLGLDEEDEMLQHLVVPVSDRSDGSRSTYKLPVILPHELLNKEMSENPRLDAKLADHVRRDLLPPIVTRHPVFIASRGTAHAVALYVDGVPTTKHDGVLGFWVYFLQSPKRHLSVVIKKSRLCKCGCRGWCTMYNIFEWFHASFKPMAIGMHPCVNWDGSEITCPIRKALACGVELLFKAFCGAIKGDWQEFAHTFGFSTWQTKMPPCLSCWGNKGQLLAGR